MKIIRKIAPYLMFSLFALTFIASAGNVLAQAGTIPNPGFSDVNNNNLSSISGLWNILLTVVKWIYTILFIVAVVFILLAAYNFVTSKGDPKKTEEAKKQLLYAIVGIAVGLLSFIIVNLVKNSLNSGLSS